MQYQIYIGLLFFVVISPCQSMESVSADLAHFSISNIQKDIEWLGELFEKQEREAIRKNERIREKLLKTNNKTSFQELNYDDKEGRIIVTPRYEVQTKCKTQVLQRENGVAEYKVQTKCKTQVLQRENGVAEYKVQTKCKTQILGVPDKEYNKVRGKEYIG
ncbi:uncharacterized protein LOC126909073 isoform X2 [Daktulosphaira vitifoliae]|uniref:uncharacterized protein LOC126909073 isoform X2 n=1 Tax=Daktulosphaira vitifoliae TaxID=58002 RepID=UPI0021AA2B17|nr:uncharacterized protein LOC126909073 isoform X2 [Daktulosphaira vitifoliae]